MHSADQLSIIEFGQDIAYPHSHGAPVFCGYPVSPQDFLLKINVGSFTTADISISIKDGKLVVAARRADCRHFEFSKNNELAIIVPFRMAPQCVKGYLSAGVLTLKYEPHRCTAVQLAA